MIITLTDKGYDEVGEMSDGDRLEDVLKERDQLGDYLEEARGEVNALAEEIETLKDKLTAAPDREEIEAAKTHRGEDPS